MKQYIFMHKGGKRLSKERRTLFTAAGKWTGAQRNRLVAMLLVAAIGLSLSASLISDAVAVMTDPGLCEHHPIHTAACGYEAETSACGFLCPVCSPEAYPAMDGRVTIRVPEGEDNTVSAGERLDLLADVLVEAEEAGDCRVSVYSVIDSATELPAELEEGRYLTPDAGADYLAVYASYNGDRELTAAADRAVTAVAAAPLAETMEQVPVTNNISNARYTVTAEVDYSKCASNDIRFSQFSLSIATSPALTEAEKSRYCDEKGYDYVGDCGLWAVSVGTSGTGSGAVLNDALITFTISDEDGIEGLGAGQTLLTAFAYANNGTLVSNRKIDIINFRQNEAGLYTSVSLRMTYNDLGASSRFVLMSANEREHPELAVPETFIAYDNGTKDGLADPGASIAAAGTKFTVTFPTGATFYRDTEDGSRVWLDAEGIGALTLNLEQYTQSTLDFDFISHRELINRHMSWHTGINFPDSGGASTNDAQFWRAWLEDKDGNEVDVQLPTGEKAKVVVEYLNAASALKGDLGTRRTCVMDMGSPSVAVPDAFVDTDDYALETSYIPGEIGKTDTHYTLLTYYIGNGGTAWGNLVALCSMKLPPAYMQNASIQKIADGSAAWDNPEPDGSDKPGNDSSPDNRIVRTFDSVVYTLQLVSAARSTDDTMDQYVAVVEAELPLDITQARFDSTSLSSVFTGDEDWRIEYKDPDGNNLYVEDKTGIYQCDDNGNKTGTKVSINNIASGSSAGGNSYRTSVASQRLVAYRLVTTTSNSQTAVPGTETVTVQINVTAAQNGDKIEPGFNCYVKGNKDNFTSEQLNGQYVVSAPSTANRIETKGTDKSVTVTAAARYNIAVRRNADSQYSSYFDFEIGQESSADAGGTYGRMFCYGVVVQLFNETNVMKDGMMDGAVLAEKGLRGIELPVGGITFDLEVTGNAGKSGSTDDYSAILWDYALSYEKTRSGQWGRNLYWNNSDASTFPKGAAVYSTGSSRTNAAYASGAWSVRAESNTPGDLTADGKTTASITNTGSGVAYHVTVQGFDFDFDNFTFPSQSCGNAGDVNWLAPQFIGTFSAGYFQVLQKYPENPTATASPEIVVELRNFEAVSQSGMKASEEAHAYTSEIGGTNDNRRAENVAVYTPGGISQHNSFGDRNSGHGSISTGFLGTDYWEGPSYDAYTYAGSSIYLWGAAQLSRNSDGVVSAYNLLQKFDSRVLSIDTDPSVYIRYTEGNNDNAWPADGWSTNKEGSTLLPAAGGYKILYAADPLYPDGWDSNIPAQMDRMNKATESDLIYFESLEALETAKYTCIAILLEVRNADIPAGCYPGLRIPVKVSPDTENIGSTIATTNAARMWTKARGSATDVLVNVSWADGSQNGLTRTEAEQLTSFKNTIVNSSGKDIYSDYWTENKNQTGTVDAVLQSETGDSTVRYLIPGYNQFDYQKTEYTNGTKIEGTHLGYQQGMSLLVIGYESSVSVKVENTRTNQASTDSDLSGNVSFETKHSDWNPLYTITGIRTTATDPGGVGIADEKTNLTITAQVINTANKSEISIGTESFYVCLPTGETDADGEPIVEKILVSEDEENPTEVTFTTSTGGRSTYRIYAERQGMAASAVFHLLDVPVGVGLPDIQFQGQLGQDIEHTGNYSVQVGIQGEGDSRALESGNGNVAQVSVTTVILGGTSLFKRVDKTLIEQNGTFTYSISYTNDADSEMEGKFYLYDLMPYNGDIRGSHFAWDGDIYTASDELTVESVSGSLTGVTGSASSTVARIYYNTIPGSVLRSFVDFAESAKTNGLDGQRIYTNEQLTAGEDIDNLLRNVLLGNDSNGIWYVIRAEEKDAANPTPVPIYTYEADRPDEVSGINTEAVEYAYSDPFGEVRVKDGYLFYNPRTRQTAKTGEEILMGDGSGRKVKLQCYKMFRWLGVIHPGEDGNNTLNAGTSNLTNASCLYAVVEHLDAKATLTMSATVKTDKNEAADRYGNIAHSWKSGDDRSGSNLVSNKVTTYVVGRELSGLVWEDLDRNGARETTEALIPGVTCTLFKWNGKEYVPVTGGEGPHGRLISVTYRAADGGTVTKRIAKGETVQLTTGADGKYCFSDLATGKYVVAFSGDVLTSYIQETGYQKSGVGGSINNDGVANEAQYPGIDSSIYRYCIQYSEKEPNLYLHTLEEMRQDASLLDNSVERIVYKDLGLVADHARLPATGGWGTLPWTAGGLVMICASLSLGWLGRKKYRETI